MCVVLLVSFTSGAVVVCYFFFVFVVFIGNAAAFDCFVCCVFLSVAFSALVPYTLFVADWS